MYRCDCGRHSLPFLKILTSGGTGRKLAGGSHDSVADLDHRLYSVLLNESELVMMLSPKSIASSAALSDVLWLASL